MQAILVIFVLAVLVEGIIEYFGAPISAAYKPYAAAIVGIMAALAYNADLLFLLGYPAQVPYVGAILTGIVISRGSNYLNDLISRLGVIRAPATTVDTAELRPADPTTPSEVRS